MSHAPNDEPTSIMDDLPGDDLPGGRSGGGALVPVGESPFGRHQRVAEALLRTLEQALVHQADHDGRIRVRELHRAVDLMVRHGETLTPLFAANCRRCVSDGSVTAVERLVAHLEDHRRRDHLTRLLFSTIAVGVPATVDPLTGVEFPRALVGGLQGTLASLFFEREREAMNADARVIYQKIGTDRDEEVWTRVDADDALPIVTDAVFIRVLLRFKQFSFQRRKFIAQMGDALRDRGLNVPFDQEAFVTLFDSMFGRLRSGLRTEFGRARLDTRHGDETATHMLRIFDEFDRFREEVVNAPRAPMERQKMMHARGGGGGSARRGVGRW